MVNDINEILNFVESCKEEGTLPNEEVICPECDNIEDEDYCCTNCWGKNRISSDDLIEILYNYIKNK